MHDPQGQSEYLKLLALQPLRPLQPWECDLLSKLVSAAGLPASLVAREALEAYRVREMPDGGMGSLRFETTGPRHGAKFTVSEFWYSDVDGVAVSFALNLDQHDKPWEINAWKVDFSTLRRPPAVGDLRATP